jgi:hypothetical protein
MNWPPCRFIERSVDANSEDINFTPCPFPQRFRYLYDEKFEIEEEKKGRSFNIEPEEGEEVVGDEYCDIHMTQDMKRYNINYETMIMFMFCYDFTSQTKAINEWMNHTEESKNEIELKFETPDEDAVWVKKIRCELRFIKISYVAFDSIMWIVENGGMDVFGISRLNTVMNDVVEVIDSINEVENEVETGNEDM